MKPVSRTTAWLLVAVLTPCPAVAQTVRLAAFGAATTNSEVQETRQARGLGFGIAVRADQSRFRAEASFLHAGLQADFSSQPDYDVDEVDLVVSWFWKPYLAAQVGAFRRFTSPEFAAQDVGAVRIGVLSETRLARIAGLWVRGSYLPLSRFSGGGNATVGLEIGLGVEVGEPAARLQGFAAFDYQRIDRTAAADAPLQFSVGRVGIQVRP